MLPCYVWHSSACDFHPPSRTFRPLFTSTDIFMGMEESPHFDADGRNILTVIIMVTGKGLLKLRSAQLKHGS